MNGAAPATHVKSCIIVDGQRVGTFDNTYPRCVADIFEHNTLVITSIDTDYVMREYPSEQWMEATVYAASGYPDYSHINHAHERETAHAR